MGANKLFGVFLSLFVVILLLTIIANAIVMFNLKSDITRFEQVVIVYAKNNGGFNDSEINFDDFIKKAIKDTRLENKISNLTLSHNINEKLQKGTIISVSVIPNYGFIIPFADKEIQVNGIEIKRSGVVVDYYK